MHVLLDCVHFPCEHGEHIIICVIYLYIVIWMIISMWEICEKNFIIHSKIRFKKLGASLKGTPGNICMPWYQYTQRGGYWNFHFRLAAILKNGRNGQSVPVFISRRPGDGIYCNAPRPSVCPSVMFSFRTVTQKRITVFSLNFAGTCTKWWGCAV